VTFAREGAQVFCVDRNGRRAEETVKIIAAKGGKAAAFTAEHPAPGMSRRWWRRA